MRVFSALHARWLRKGIVPVRSSRAAVSGHKPLSGKLTELLLSNAICCRAGHDDKEEAACSETRFP